MYTCVYFTCVYFQPLKPLIRAVDSVQLIGSPESLALLHSMKYPPDYLHWCGQWTFSYLRLHLFTSQSSPVFMNFISLLLPRPVINYTWRCHVINVIHCVIVTQAYWLRLVVVQDNIPLTVKIITTFTNVGWNTWIFNSQIIDFMLYESLFVQKTNCEKNIDKSTKI